MSTLVQLDPQAEGSPWSYALRMLGGRSRLLLVYGLLLGVLFAASHQLAGPEGGLPLVCLSFGLAFSALWLADRRSWPVMAAIQLGIEFAVGLLVSPLPWITLLCMAGGHTAAALVGALAARRQFGIRARVQVAMLLQFMVAAAVAALASLPFTLLAASLDGLPGSHVEWALTAVFADTIGALLLVPILMTWGNPRREVFPLLPTRLRVELVVLAALQALITYHVFSFDAVLDSRAVRLPPALVLPLMLYAVARFPPRWGTLLVLGTVMLATGVVAHGGNPYAVVDPFVRTLWVQLTAGTVVALANVLIAYLTSHRLVMAALANAESRYRSFVELSSEAVWRVELLQPMPVRLDVAQQCAWLREHARIVERSDSYARIGGEGDPERWSAAVPWVPAFEQHLPVIRDLAYSVAELPFQTERAGRRHAYLSSFHGVVSGGELRRLWGVARDVTELMELNASLQRQQQRLQHYSQQLVTAEEQARRATAMDLHDGIGQELVGLNLTLKALGDQLPPAQRQLVDGLRARLDHMQARTRELISDLSPPGLYDLGLGAAMQWLADELRERDGLHVALDAEVDEAHVPLQLRVVVFKVVRELLRNVARHAGVDRANLWLRGDAHSLLVSVQDEGRGFQWNPEGNGPLQPGGFGLISVIERVKGEGGQLAVDTAPGRGATVTLEFRLDADAGADAARDAARA